LAEEKNERLWQAEYAGSGTFIITKPKRNRRKLSAQRRKKTERGSRK
jgi:hypothetical protein